MFTSDEEEKKYIPPDYSNDPEDDEDDDDDDDISEDDDGEIENYLDNQEQLNKKTMTTTPFNSTSGWGTNNNSSSPWSTGTQQSPWGQTQSSPWSKPNTPSWGSNTPGWGTNNGTSWGGANTWNSNNQSGKKEIDRQKKVIFCDVLDCLVETFQSSGKPGLLPRGIYDIRLRFEVWDKIACFNPTRVYAMVPRC